jgi:transposase
VRREWFLLFFIGTTGHKRWVKWYREGQQYRLAQGIGKQYSYGKGTEELSENEQLKRENEFLKAQLEILKKYQEIERSWFQKL